jgi:hypothetical protein
VIRVHNAVNSAMATMTSASNMYSPPYKSYSNSYYTYRSDYSSLSRSRTDTQLPKSDLPGVHSQSRSRRFQSPVRRDSESSSSAIYPRPLPTRNPPAQSSVAQAVRRLQSTKVGTGSDLLGSTKSVPVKARHTDAFEKSDSHYLNRSKATQIPSVHSTAATENALVKTTTRRDSHKDNQNGLTPLSSDLESKSARRRSASLGATARIGTNAAELDNCQDNAPTTVCKVQDKAGDSDKEDKYCNTRTSQVSSDTGSKNESRSETVKATGQILGGTASDDYRNRGSGQQLTSIVESDRSALARRDSTSEFLVSYVYLFHFVYHSIL